MSQDEGSLQNSSLAQIQNGVGTLAKKVAALLCLVSNRGRSLKGEGRLIVLHRTLGPITDACSKGRTSKSPATSSRHSYSQPPAVAF